MLEIKYVGDKFETFATDFESKDVVDDFTDC